MQDGAVRLDRMVAAGLQDASDIALGHGMPGQARQWADRVSDPIRPAVSDTMMVSSVTSAMRSA